MMESNSFVIIVEQMVADFDGVSISIPEELPPEVWKLILDNIKDSPTTLVSCYNTCKSWRDLLEEKKSEFYFPLILPFLEKYLSNNDLLKCRQVSTSWKRTMDEHRQSEVPPFDRYRFFGRGLLEAGGVASMSSSPKLLGCNHFYWDDDPRDFLDAMTNHPGNPFPTRSVIVDLVTAEAYSDFQRVLLEFGKEIRTLVLICRGDDDAASASLLQPVFNHCTNLVSLSIMMPDGCWERYDVWVSLRWMHGTPTQLPEIPSLVSLNIYGEGSGSVVEALLHRYGRQLRRLEVNQEVMTDALFFANVNFRYFWHPYRDSSSTGTQILPSLFLNLDTLKVGHRGRGKLLQVLETLKYCKFPSLETLSFCDNNNFEVSGGESVSFSGRVLIRAINPFSASLVQLFLPFHKTKFIRLPTVVHDPNSRRMLERELAVQFPKLRTLGVSYSVMHSQKSLETLLKKFVALEELIFYDYASLRVGKGVLPEQREHYCKTRWREMLEKLEGFWELVRSLKLISVNRGISHATEVFRLNRPQSQKNLEEQREGAIHALWECKSSP